MKKLLKALLVVSVGTIGTCAIIWVSSTTASSAQQASARGQAFGMFIAVAVIALIGLAIFNRSRHKQ